MGADAHRPGADKGGREHGSIGVIVAVVIMCLVWGSTWLVVRKGLDEMPPLGSAGVRFLVAGALMLVIAPFIARAEGGRKPTFDLVLVMATGNFAISYGIVYWTEVNLPSSLVAILWGVFPLMTAVVGHVYLPASRIVGVQWVGLTIGFVGVVLLLWTDARAASTDGLTEGVILLLSPLVSAFATTYVKKHGSDVSAALLNRQALLLGGVFLCAAALLVEDGIELPPSAAAWWSVVYLAVFGTVLTFTLYFWVLRRANPVSLSLIAYVTPAIALFLGVQFGAEAITPSTLPGLALILFGCLLVLKRPTGDVRRGS